MRIPAWMRRGPPSIAVPAEEPDVSDAVANHCDTRERVVTERAAHCDEPAVDSRK